MESKHNVDLILNTGIQFISIPVNIDDSLQLEDRPYFAERVVCTEADQQVYKLTRVLHLETYDIYIDPEEVNQSAINAFGEIDEEKVDLEFLKTIDSESIYTVGLRETVEMCEGNWIPLPFFRARGDSKQPFHEGPRSWCRCNLQKNAVDDVSSHTLTLAFDTNSVSALENESYDRPTDQDASDTGNERFRCVTEKRHAPEFFTSKMVNERLYELFMINSNGRGSVVHELKHLAIYQVFIMLLESLNALPEIGLLNGATVVEVGLTLDIGNSRTCGLLCERSRPFDTGKIDLTNARALNLRNLSKPHELCDEPFDMHLVFAEETFGSVSPIRADQPFYWPSLVRLGPEAIQLTTLFESEDSHATMSSPKKYLWDKSRATVPWIKVDKDNHVGYHAYTRISKAIFGCASHLTSDGKVIKSYDNATHFPATDSLYSRSSLMTLAIYEILLHAISQINHPDFRKDMGRSSFKRVLKDLVLTCPTAMSVQEHELLMKRASDAIDLLVLTHGVKGVNLIPSRPRPSIGEARKWKFDEATCSQLAYLYGEVVHKFNSNTELLVSLKGKKSSDGSESMKIASIDIGGGTTDLMICRYQVEQHSPVPYLRLEPIFWEGFNVAGDDIIKRLVEKIFIVNLHHRLREMGAVNISSILNRLFGPNIGGQSASERIKRRQFANQIAAPFAHKCMSLIAETDSDSFEMTLKDVDINDELTKGHLTSYINDTISRTCNLDSFLIEDVVFAVDRVAVEEGVADVIGGVLEQLSFIIEHQDCDVVLLSGRPSRLPVIFEVLIKSGSIRPDKVVSLGDHRFGHWYPFADPNGFVSDPKSSVCVGSLIAYLNMNDGLPGLRMDLSGLDSLSSTASYIGVVKSDSKISTDEVLLSPHHEGGSFSFMGESVIIGTRQMKSSDWTATSLYLFDFVQEKKELLDREGFSYPVSVHVSRSSEGPEFLDSDNLRIVDAAGQHLDPSYFDFKLMTLNMAREHWKESGSFIVDINN